MAPWLLQIILINGYKDARRQGLPVSAHLLDERQVMFHDNHHVESRLENTYYHISWYQSILETIQHILLSDKLDKIGRKL